MRASIILVPHFLQIGRTMASDRCVAGLKNTTPNPHRPNDKLRPATGNGPAKSHIVKRNHRCSQNGQWGVERGQYQLGRPAFCTILLGNVARDLAPKRAFLLKAGALAQVGGRSRQTVTLFGFVLIVGAERHDARLCHRG